jgi:hypothetical protein
MTSNEFDDLKIYHCLLNEYENGKVLLVKDQPDCSCSGSSVLAASSSSSSSPIAASSSSVSSGLFSDDG